MSTSACSYCSTLMPSGTLGSPPGRRPIPRHSRRGEPSLRRRGEAYALRAVRWEFAAPDDHDDVQDHVAADRGDHAASEQVGEAEDAARDDRVPDDPPAELAVPQVVDGDDDGASQ